MVHRTLHQARTNKSFELTDPNLLQNELHQPFNDGELADAISHLQSYKATGKDEVHNLMIKTGGKNFRLVLLTIFNWCLEKGYFPSKWKQGLILPVPKPNKKDYQLPTNYRPITLLSCLSKVLERLLARRLI